MYEGFVVASASCNGCAADYLQVVLGPAAFIVREHGGTAIYELDADPIPQQVRQELRDGQSVRLRGWFKTTGHAEGCDKVMSKSRARRIRVQAGLDPVPAQEKP